MARDFRKAGHSEDAQLAVPTRFTSQRLVTIQALRGVAALMVVFHHVLHQSPGFLAVLPTEAGQAGVDLFFVISGFVMVYVTQDRERSPQQFLAMRAARIIPVYWFYTLSAALLMFILPQLFRSNELSLKHVVLSLLFIPHQTGTDSISPVVKQGWTLNYEMFFYLLFAIAMMIALRHRATLAISALALMAITGYFLQFSGASLGTADFYFQNIILEFALGMAIGIIFLRGGLNRIGSTFGALMVAVGFCALFALDPLYASSTRILVYGLPAALIVIGVLAFESRSQVPRMQFMEFMGDTSYSLYLVHIFPVAILRAIWPMPMDGAMSFTLFLAASVVSAVGMGAISYYAVEKTSLKYLRKVIARHLSS